MTQMLDVVITKYPAVLDHGLGALPRRTLHRVLLLLPLKGITGAGPPRVRSCARPRR